ncbi:MAG: YidC/Oxa1 family membrane protein insertase [Acetatifactor sp.]|nr:YidC/Oxa1 family membrane protein insertase [Acetatifactor sp.]
MSQFLYNVFIMPVESIVEFIFFFMNKVFPDQPAVSILFVSLTINFLILPLYKRADDMQEREREKVASMEHWNKHIRKTFKGDERYMMQSAYYRIEGYKPLYAIAGSLSLLFQIPFFIAAYHFLSHLELLNGVGFSVIPDLGAPDGIIKLGGLSVNLLPVLMTAINIVSGAIYTKGFKLKDKLQLYLMALLFLVLLYTSPSGLVLYWTCNNLFSLGKNIVFKYGKRGRWAFNILAASAGTFLFVKLMTSHRLVVRRQYFIFGMIVLVSYLPLLLTLTQKRTKRITEKLAKILAPKEGEQKSINRLFWIGAVFNTIFMGVMIPAQLIGSSPVEFGTLVNDGPLSLILSTVALYIGYFLLWIGIFYLISNDFVKKLFAYGIWLFSICSLINYYAFFSKFGIMNYLLIFDQAPVYNDKSKLINLAVLAAACVVLIFFVKKWSKAAISILSILSLMVAILSAVSIYNTHQNLVEEGYYIAKQDTTIKPTVPLSRNGKNIIVLMLDRAVSEYVPYIFKEMPEVAKSFEDFVYYPNTISYGGCTNFATPALFGGYEYTPAEIDKRADELLMYKQNEALKVLPVLFAENGYKVDVLDPPYANYKEYTDVSIYDGYENITGHATRDKYAHYEYHNDEELVVQKKHMAFYSLFRTMPVLLQNSIYDEGNYLGKPIDFFGEGAFFYCAESYATLDYFDEYTYIEEGDQNRLLVMTNLLTHQPTLLQTPDYSIGYNIEPIPYSAERQAEYVINDQMLYMTDVSAVQHYHVNAAAYMLLAKYFDHLKQEGVYDNTRIIIVSDHGWPVYQMDDVALTDIVSLETFNPILFVKDFAGSDALDQGAVWNMEECNLNVCETFMTNADVATLCTAGTISDPVNPFTGKVISNAEKTLHDQLVTTSYWSSVNTNNGTVFDTTGCPWMTFNGGYVKDRDNWTVLDLEE